MKRAIIIVIDSMGIGAMSDYEQYGDVFECNTLKNVSDFCGGLKLPNLSKLGLGNIQKLGVEPVSNPIGQYGKMSEKSKGKDTTTGHWELAGLVLDEAFATFPNGFPKKIIDEFVEKTDCGGILANIPASGTTIIEQLNDEHQKTKFPIVYTSADSVFQIAVDTDLIPLDTLYKWCEIAREILPNNVSRVIARPYRVIDGVPTRISKDRHDYAVAPFGDTILNKLEKAGKKVFGIGKIEDIFCKSGVTHAVHTGTNKQGLEFTLDAVKNEIDLNELSCRTRFGMAPNSVDSEILKPVQNDNFASLIFTNLVDTDMLFGHRNDAKGYGNALEEIDLALGEIIETLEDDDLLIITADHGCDPTVAGTDHTREHVPVLFYNKNIEPKNLGLLNGFDNVAKRVEEWLK